MSDIMKKINEYFDTVSDEKFLTDSVKAGIRLLCKLHTDFDPINPVETTCDNCNQLAEAYAKSERFRDMKECDAE